MGVIGRPYRVVYEGKFFRTGLTDVQAIVLKPNNAQAGIFAMPELPSPFDGRYAFDYITTFADPEGEYFVKVFSPTEGLEDTCRISLYNAQPAPNPGTDSDLISGTVNDAIDPISGAVLDSDQAEGVVIDGESITGESDDASTADGTVQDDDGVEGQATSDEIEGEV